MVEMLKKKWIAVFCGSGDGAAPEYLATARELGRRIAEKKYGLVYGGATVGTMGAIANATLAAGGEVVGVIPDVIMNLEIGHRGLTELHIVRTMHERKALMASRADAFVALPGGYGTMDEFCEVLTWRQLRIHDKPIGLLNYRGYYDALLALFDSMVREGFIGPYTRSLFVDAPTIEELLAMMFATKNLP